MSEKPNPVFQSRALFVIDVQQGLIAGPESVPDAVEVRQAIHDVLESVRHHNDIAQLNSKLSKRVKIVFVQHNDRDPEDPMYKGKSTWELIFSPREDDDAECLVFKDVGNVFESNAQLAQELRLQGITRMAVTGLQSDCCVRASIRGAIDSGFEAANIILLQGAHSTYDAADASRSYAQIQRDVEGELAGLGVRLQGWRDFVSLDV
ncbi:hypothetical protein KC343_g11601 [Hortaea werneckii]|nr:hypothetical protein KC352_g21968 [Hortaea werneckii]KAI7556574.1 hypothetical protein KC317_g12174 [Hortaea werneckii]KAI7603630.1 hypothetical protein KC346_g11804 [Hortaea werneckii]KAI7611350.1 hypothetical protein KC343_g11601 [Hortaea werneckii]KAI7677034.1 hypothetical protein KC319_g4125 [Hortaea werneckii]